MKITQWLLGLVPALDLAHGLQFPLGRAKSHKGGSEASLIQFLGPHRVEAGSVQNIRLGFSQRFAGKLHVVYGDCSINLAVEASQQVVSFLLPDSDHPDRLVWVVPSDAQDSQCLQAFHGCTIVGRSPPIAIEKAPHNPRAESQIDGDSVIWFDGVEYMRSQDSSKAVVNSVAAKDSSIAIVGAGIAGLMTSHLLSSIGIHNWHIHEASQRLGGRIRTAYLNGTSPDDYQYFDMGPMRLATKIRYTGTGEVLPFEDHRLVFSLIDTLNHLNADHHPELAMTFLPFDKITDDYGGMNSHTLQDLGEDEQQKYTEYLAHKMYRAHKQALSAGSPHWSEGAYLRQLLNPRDPMINYIADREDTPIWESLYWNKYFAASAWQSLDKGFESLPRAFAPHVADKITLGRRISGLSYNESADKVSLLWRNDPNDWDPAAEQYDYAVVAAPFSMLRAWNLPEYSELLDKAIHDLHFTQSCKVALHYRTRFWERGDKAQYRGCARVSDYPSVGDVCYPPYQVNSSGPAVVMASFTTGNMARTIAALGETNAVALAQRGMVHAHGKVANEEFTGIYEHVCWEHDEFQGGAWASPLGDQQEKFLPAIYRTEAKTIFMGEHTAYTHAWLSSAVDSAFRGTVQLLLDLGLVEEAREIVETWKARWIVL
ncbi:flavin monoamine oxidase family protein [Aspergillus homomorphus CBS 101889]|uniref:Amine oxidase domain-containing protein n=1 Tax=Aspergillus homomorphus (strain CBS 101889) TaxID=1450537 RepID=A0A395HN62_ASPHC|nr:hypothetical protein BO97DRAFT_472440 [Aspergillus homomorphus CBS 101889]RAL09382.1 hypothetical protein BO97DRAFT_472440 [Aspergillus homomorphus CBS 101889]